MYHLTTPLREGTYDPALQMLHRFATADIIKQIKLNHTSKPVDYRGLDGVF